MSNYRFVSVGITTVNYNINFFGDGVSCTPSQIKSMQTVDTSAFPSTMTKMKGQAIAYSDVTKTLVACGGIQVNFLTEEF